eukprot:358855-Chlamydomonas_euryale.AAC.2
MVHLGWETWFHGGVGRVGSGMVHLGWEAWFHGVFDALTCRPSELRLVGLPIGRPANRPTCRLDAVNRSTCQSATLSGGRRVDLSTCQAVMLATCRPVNLATCRPVNLATCRPTDASTCLSVNLQCLMWCPAPLPRLSRLAPSASTSPPNKMTA